MIALSLVCLAASAASADNWPQWRGASHNGICTEKNLPITWSPNENVAWRFKLPGPAGATPAVWDDRVFVSTVDGADLYLFCVGTDGELRWKQQLGSGNKDVRGDEGNSASPSPVTDGQHVWCGMANGDFACFTVDGKPVWNLNLQDRYGEFQIAFGMTSTPILDDDRLYFQFIHGDRKAETHESLVVALDKRTGDEIWKQTRVSDAYGESELAYSSPTFYSDGQQKIFISHGADYTIGHSIEDGRELWRLGGLNPHPEKSGKPYHDSFRFVATPAAANGLVVVPTAKNGPVVGLRPDGQGDVTESSTVRWKRAENTPDVPSPLIVDGLVYLCRENGNLICLEAESGKELYEERTHRDNHRASPVYADGYIYLTARDGVVSVVKAGREFDLVATNKIGEAMSASPAISNGTIYLRTFDALWAIRKK